MLAVYDGSNNLIQRFEYADGRMPVAAKINGTRYFLAYDQVGSLRIVFNEAGEVVKQIDYDSYGNILADSNTAIQIPFGFAGGLFDSDTNLVRFGYRDYMPEIGKWTAKDPIDFAGGQSNLFGYVENDPVNWVDPWGLISTSEVGNIIFNETRSLSGQNINDARLNLAHSVYNADDKWGNNRSKHAGSAPTTVGSIPKAEQGTYTDCQLAAIKAKLQHDYGIDPTNGATNFNFRNSNSTSPFWKLPLKTQVGPLNNSYPSSTLNSSGIYANTYGK